MTDRAIVVRTDKSAVVMTADGTGTAWLCDRYTEASVHVDVSQVTGTTPTLDVTVQTSADNTNWHAHTALTQLTDSTTAADAQVTNISKYIRLDYNLGGTTPSFTVTALIVLKT